MSMPHPRVPRDEDDITRALRAVIPPLSADDFGALMADIAEHGIQAPVEVDEEGRILDGFHRVRAWQKLRAEGRPLPDYPRIVRAFGTDAERVEHAVRLNRSRMSPAQRERAASTLVRMGLPARRAALSAGACTSSTLPTDDGPDASRRFPAILAHSAADAEAAARTLRMLKELGPAGDLLAGTPFETHARSLARLLRLRRESPALCERAAELLASGRASTAAHAERMARSETPTSSPLPFADIQAPLLIVGRAERLPLRDESVDLIITSPPYNIGPKPGRPETRSHGYSVSGGRAWAGVTNEAVMPEEEYQAWQLRVLAELHRVARRGASLFYNHKVRQRRGRALFPHSWLLHPDNPWTVRQELVWDRGSTHNHERSYFWPHDERVFWLTKGDPILPDRPINVPTVLRLHGPLPSPYHDSPFPQDLPRLLLRAIARPGMTVLDPFCGSGSTLAAALEAGCLAVGVDVSPSALRAACVRFGWPQPAAALAP
jgi:site-specific DNA-methyltransferase (adenine-specific)